MLLALREHRHGVHERDRGGAGDEPGCLEKRAARHRHWQISWMARM